MKASNTSSTTWAELWSQLNLNTTLREIVAHSYPHDLEGTTLFGWPKHACHFKSQSPMYSHNETWVLELQTSYLSHFAISIRHDFCTPKGGQRSNSRIFSSSSFSLGNLKATQRHFGRGSRSQYNLRRWCMVDAFWRCIKIRSYMHDHYRSGGGICFVRESHSSSCILTDRILLQQRSWV